MSDIKKDAFAWTTQLPSVICQFQMYNIYKIILFMINYTKEA